MSTCMYAIIGKDSRRYMHISIGTSGYQTARAVADISINNVWCPIKWNPCILRRGILHGPRTNTFIIRFIESPDEVHAQKLSFLSSRMSMRDVLRPLLLQGSPIS